MCSPESPQGTGACTVGHSHDTQLSALGQLPVGRMREEEQVDGEGEPGPEKGGNVPKVTQAATDKRLGLTLAS